MSFVVFPEAGTSDLHLHTSVDMFWFVVVGKIIFTNENGEVIGDLGPEQGMVIPRGYAFRYQTIPDAEKGFVEAYRFTAHDHPMRDDDDDRVWLDGPRSGELSVIEPIERSIHEPRAFTYERPVVDSGKAMDILSITDRGIFAFQVLRSGGETNMHSHNHLDGFWFVRRGRARFYTGGSDGNFVLAELGENEGVLIPRSYPYWFEAIIESDDDECEILQMEVSDLRLTGKLADLTSDRNDFTPPNEAQLKARIERTGDGLRAVKVKNHATSESV